MLREGNARAAMMSAMTITIATPDRRTVAALARTAVEPARLTGCLERAASWFAGARVVEARCAALPFDPGAHTFALLGELRLARPTSWDGVRRVALALADELRAAGFAVE